MKAFYQSTIDESLHQLAVDQANGLDEKEIQKRREHCGENRLESKKKISIFKLFFSQFKDVLIIILIVSAIVSLGLSFVEEEASHTEGLLILGIVLAIAIVGFLNEYKAEKTVEALRKLVGHSAKVRRHGEIVEIPAVELVPGDIVMIEEGMKVPADLRLLKANNLKLNEASLTGESLPVNKQTAPISGKVSLGDQKNMLFSGTLVNIGSGEAVVTTTGGGTEIGKIAGLVDDVEEEQTPMQRKLDALGKQLGVGIIFISLIVFAVIFFFDREILDASLATRLIFAFTAAVALAVAAIPEGLAFVVRISLALGARRMAAKNALVRRLSAVEALGSTDTICSDKTGTLTRGEMTVREIFTNGKFYEVSGTGYDRDGEFAQEGKTVKLDELESVLTIGLLCNDARLKGDDNIIGDPTEGALVVAAAKAKITRDQIDAEMARLDENPFSSDRKMMSTLHKQGKQHFVAIKGAPEIVLGQCTHILKNGKVSKITKQDKEAVLDANKSMASQALRVLGFAQKTSPNAISKKDMEKNLTFVGLQGMMDPPRKEVVEVIHRVQSEAGMRVIMITGDYIETAKAVAKEIGIKGESISGVEIDEMSKSEFEKRVEKIGVYARVNPEHKIRIVQALKANGHQVAMTGDGVNDAPAIKAADIGIAMGITGTDAAKEASDMILLDDQFLTIINAIEEGRGIFDNVRKFVNYLLSANIAEVLVILFGVIIFQDLVLTAAQLLFINIVTDGLPAVALGSDPSEKGIMRFKPYHFQGSILNARIWVEMFLFGAMMTVALLWQFDQRDGALAVSFAFAAMVIYEMIRLIDIRTDYRIKWFSNPWLSVAIVASLLLQVTVIHFEPVANLFGAVSIPITDWVEMLIVGVVLLVAMKIANPILDKFLPERPVNA